MGGDSGGPQGPDLREGVPLERLREGEPFAARVGDEAVVLLKVEGEVHAVGGSCTHYGGPLAEGIAVGHSIRCPWHHACFDVRTGEAVRAPALKSLPRWSVEVRDGAVFVGEKWEPAPLESYGRHAEAPAPVVIVGGGAAGSAAAEMLRREGYRGRVIVVDPDEPAPYDRPNLSKDYLAGDAPEEWIPLRPEGFYAEHAIERVTLPAEAIDTEGRMVRLAGGARLEYGALLLATGAVPVRLPVGGAELPHVHLLRSLDDCRAIIADAVEGSRALVVGASFIGMEATGALRGRGVEVTVVAPDAVPFERTLGAELGGALKALHEEHGVEFRLGRSVSEILPDRVKLDDGSEVPADLVVVGIGVRPELRLAEEAGLETDGGVLVDEQMRTSAPAVWAAGDIARWRDPRTGERMRVEHWVVAQRQGQTAARSILGREVAFTEPPFFWTRHYDLSVAYVGHAAEWDAIEVDGDPGARDCAVRYRRGGRTLAVATIGRDRECLLAEAAMERGEEAP